MGIHLQLILTAYFVNSGWTLAQWHNANADQAVTGNRDGAGRIQEDTFNRMKKELQTAQHSNAIKKKRNLYKRSNNGNNNEKVKREVQIDDLNPVRFTSADQFEISTASSETVYEHWDETTVAAMANVSIPFNATAERIKATPEYKYRMTVILALQLYWSQLDHILRTSSMHTRFYVNKGQEIANLHQMLNETEDIVKEKTNRVQELYVQLYEEEKIIWTEKLTKIPIEREVVDDLIHRWKIIEQTFVQHNKTHSKPKDVYPTDIAWMRRVMQKAQQEPSVQYERIKKYMDTVLRLIQEQNVTILPDTATEDEFDTLVEKQMGRKYSGEVNSTELEQIGEGEFGMEPIGV